MKSTLKVSCLIAMIAAMLVVPAHGQTKSIRDAAMKVAAQQARLKPVRGRPVSVRQRIVRGAVVGATVGVNMAP